MKDFIPFELAYQLKELEFDEECLGFYDAYNGDSHLFLHDRYKPLWLVRTWRRLFSKSVSETTFVSQFYVEYINGVCLAPTFSQAFRFFREKYDLQYWLRDGGYLGKCFIQITGYKHDKIYFLSSEAMEYEEAELQCLRLLIKIAKESI
jgi:hypothetical protein